MKKAFLLTATLSILTLSGCGGQIQTRTRTTQSATVVQTQEISRALRAGADLITNQPTPTDIEFSLERYNLIRRTYWVNGMREQAISLPSEVVKPLGYIILFAPNGGVVGRFEVDGKITSLNSFLTPESEFFEIALDGSQTFRERENRWLPDVDGAFGENDRGIFFFTPQGQYIEWNGTYLYSDIPFIISDPIVQVEIN